MKATATIDSDGWLNINVLPETVQEAAALTYHAMNADVKARAVSSVHANRGQTMEQSVMSCWVSLRTFSEAKRTTRVGRK